MYIKVLTAAIFFISTSTVFASESKQSLFQCLDLANYSVDEKCTSSSISNSNDFKISQSKLALKIAEHNPNVMATVQFDPQQMLIKVIAQKPELKTAKLLIAARGQ